MSTTHTPSPTEGIDRCACGSKYWDGSLCDSCGEKFRPETDDLAEVTYADRMWLHSRLNVIGATSEEARAIRAATYWESFPAAYPAEQVKAACALHIASRNAFSTNKTQAAYMKAMYAVSALVAL
jgi:hypothetical protein